MYSWDQNTNKYLLRAFKSLRFGKCVLCLNLTCWVLSMVWWQLQEEKNNAVQDEDYDEAKRLKVPSLKFANL